MPDERTDMPYKRGISPLTTWHSQSGLLLISATWGISYMVPAEDRVPFSEVFPASLSRGMGLPMQVWGAVLLIAAVAAFVSERVIAHTRRGHPIAWRVGYGSHMALTAAYGALAVAAVVQASSEIHGSPLTAAWYGQLVSAISRTVLWGYISYLHSTYARLPRPDERPTSSGEAGR